MQRTQADPSAWGWTFGKRLPWIWPLFVLIALAFWIMKQPRLTGAKTRYSEHATLLWGLALTGGFLISPWYGDGFPRYFCPAFIAMLIWCLLGLRDSTITTRTQTWMAALLIVGVLWNASSLYRSATAGLSITSSPGSVLQEFQDKWERQRLESRNTGRPPVTDCAFAYYYPEEDFVASSMGKKGAAKLLREHGWR